MRLVFIPGFGEEADIFSRIAPALPREKLFINNLDLMGSAPSPTLTVMLYAQQLIEQHNLTQQDIIIGHSMGGWIAYIIKQLIDCPIIQIASWTDPKKVVLRFKDPAYAYWLVRKGWYFNQSIKQLLLWLSYRGKPSSDIFSKVFQHLIDSPSEYVINQLRVIMNPPETTITVRPEVRIHSKKDSIIRFPDQSTTAVPGDHFNLFTHPQEVVAVIRPFLATYEDR